MTNKYRKRSASPVERWAEQCGYRLVDIARNVSRYSWTMKVVGQHQYSTTTIGARWVDGIGFQLIDPGAL